LSQFSTNTRGATEEAALNINLAMLLLFLSARVRVRRTRALGLAQAVERRRRIAVCTGVGELGVVTGRCDATQQQPARPLTCVRKLE
jgi:hypothetical protein